MMAIIITKFKKDVHLPPNQSSETQEEGSTLALFNMVMNRDEGLAKQVERIETKSGISREQAAQAMYTRKIGLLSQSY